MSEIIKNFYSQAHILPVLLKQKAEKFDRNPDIAAEFEYWITHQAFKQVDPVTVLGYTAEKLAALSPYLDGEGAFMLLIELREQPESANQKIVNGFKIK